MCSKMGITDLQHMVQYNEPLHCAPLLQRHMGTVLQKYKYEFKSQNLIMYIDGSMPCKYSLESIEKVQ